jgi:hypothetical protein
MPDLLGAYGIEWTSVVHHGVIDQVIDRPEGLFGCVGKAMEIRRPREVRAHGMRTAASLLDQCDRFVEKLLTPSRDDNSGTFCGEADGNGSANTRTPSGHQRYGAGYHGHLASHGSSYEPAEGSQVSQRAGLVRVSMVS